MQYVSMQYINIQYVNVNMQYASIAALQYVMQ